MVTNTFENSLLAIQEEAFTRNDLDRTNTERSRISIFQFCPVLIKTAFRHIEGRHIRRPECRGMHDKLLIDRTVIINDIRQRQCRLHQHFSVRVAKACLHGILLRIGSGRQIDLCVYIYFGELFLYDRCRYKGSPNRDMGIFRDNNMHVTIQAGSGIPAGRFRQVFQADSQRILLPRFQILCNIKMERIISVRPITDFLSVDIYFGVAHRPVKQDRSLLPVGKLGHLKLGTVPTHTDKRQTSRTTGVFHCLFLAIL